MTKKLIDLGWDKESDELVDLGFGSPATKQSTGATGDFTSITLYDGDTKLGNT